METTAKASAVTLLKAASDDLAKINALALEPLSAEQVFTFKVNACDTRVDRDMEAFAPETLRQLAKLYVGKTVIFDHLWSASGQTARVYDAGVKQADDAETLQLRCYMLQNEQTQPVIDAIKGGILREVSVGCAIAKRTCSICGGDYAGCGHLKGQTYDGKVCTVLLDDATDAYELSFVAVPAQRGAGVTKAAGVQLVDTDEQAQQKQALRAQKTKRAKARLDMFRKFI